MPRQKRIDEAGRIYHVLNRRNARQPIFLKPEDYETMKHSSAFLRRDWKSILLNYLLLR